MEKRYMMNTRDLKIVELQRLLEEDEDYFRRVIESIRL